LKRLVVPFMATVVAASIIAVGCAGTPPAPTPTKAAAAAPTTAPAAAPTKAPAAAATAAPTKAAAPTAAKLNFPEKGKTVTIIVPWSAGGSNDVYCRLLAPYLEKEMGTPFQVVNRPEASSQVGMTELAKAKPDGYTLGLNSLQTTISVYLDAERKAAFDRKSFQPVAVGIHEAFWVGVKGDGPYKTLKDVIDAAKAKPETVKMGTNGVGSPSHLTALMLEKEAGVKFAAVHFAGGAPNVTALLGGHVDISSNTLSGNQSHFKSGNVIPLAISDTVKSPEFPDIPTLPSMGYNVVMTRDACIDLPAGTPMPIVEYYSGLIKKISENPEFLAKAKESGTPIRYMDQNQYAKLWDEAEKQIKDVVGLIKK